MAPNLLLRNEGNHGSPIEERVFEARKFRVAIRNMRHASKKCDAVPASLIIRAYHNDAQKRYSAPGVSAMEKKINTYLELPDLVNVRG